MESSDKTESAPAADNGVDDCPLPWRKTTQKETATRPRRNHHVRVHARAGTGTQQMRKYVAVINIGGEDPVVLIAAPKDEEELITMARFDEFFLIQRERIAMLKNGAARLNACARPSCPLLVTDSRPLRISASWQGGSPKGLHAFLHDAHDIDERIHIKSHLLHPSGRR